MIIAVDKVEIWLEKVRYVEDKTMDCEQSWCC